jgi:hypothetical protein
MLLLVMQCSPLSRHLCLRSKYSPQHPVLKHSQSVVLEDGESTFSETSVLYSIIGYKVTEDVYNDTAVKSSQKKVSFEV